jgi:hypothetical protein
MRVSAAPKDAEVHKYFWSAIDLPKMRVKLDISDMWCANKVTEWHTCLPWIFSMSAAAHISYAVFRLLHFQVRASSG